MKNRTGFESFSAVIHRLWKNENLITRTKIMTGCLQKNSLCDLAVDNVMNR